MKKNHALKILALLVMFFVMFIFVSGKKEPLHEIPPNDPNNFSEAMASQFNDNVRDVLARLQEAEKKLSLLEKEKKQAIPESHSRLEEELISLKEKISALTTRTSESFEKITPHVSATIQDLDALITEPKAPLDFLNPEKNENKKASTAFYTIPAGSDFSNVTLLSALIGEVPVEGKLMQPLFPFTAIISRGNLMSANGISLPQDLIGMKIMGFSIGVGSFLDNVSCVRSYITSALFVFEDGHFVTVGEEQMKNSSELVHQESLGYLTTPFGNPCIKGQYITNAPRVFASLMAAGGIQGAGNALSKWQLAYESDGMQTKTSPIGSLPHFVAGGAINEGSQKITDWLEKRIQGSFDMVFVPASLKTPRGFLPNQFSLHISKTILIDKEHEGRQLSYGHHTEKNSDSTLR